MVLFCSSNTLLAETNSLSEHLPQQSQASSFEPRTKIYFYNPEINTARNLVLKNTWDNYLHNVGPYEFQPVDNEDDFKQLIHDQQQAAFIMAEWFYASLLDSKVPGLEFAFQGRKRSQDTYRKILISNKNVLDLKKVTIASSGSVSRAREILQSIYPELTVKDLKRLNILVVPKDIDALMAVGYGLAEMALATEVGLSKMALLNQNLFDDMVVMKQSKPFKRSVLVFKSKDTLLKLNLAKAIVSMPQQSEGIEALSLLGLDEWQVSDEMSSELAEGLRDSTILGANKKGGHNNDK